MSINRGMYKEDVVHIYHGKLLSHKRTKWCPFAATWLDIDIIILSEINKKAKDKYLMISIVGSNKVTNELFYRTETESET